MNELGCTADLPTKKAQRLYARSARAAIGRGLAERKALAAVSRILALPVYREAKTILVYMASRGEMDISELVEAALRAGKQVAYPVCDGRGGMVAAMGTEQWEVNRYGIYEPRLCEAQLIPPAQLDLVLAPGLAFDQEGYRLGWGGGYYDRFLACCKRGRCLGIAFEEQMLDNVAHEALDIPVDAVVTDRTVYSTKK